MSSLPSFIFIALSHLLFCLLLHYLLICSIFHCTRRYHYFLIYIINSKSCLSSLTFYASSLHHIFISLLPFCSVIMLYFNESVCIRFLVCFQFVFRCLLNNTSLNPVFLFVFLSHFFISFYFMIFTLSHLIRQFKCVSQAFHFYIYYFVAGHLFLLFFFF